MKKKNNIKVSKKKMKKGAVKPEGGFLGVVEKLGHKLPHPVFLFVYLGILFLTLSVVGSHLGWGNPVGKQVVKSLLDPEGIYWMFSQFVNNFAKYGTNSIFGTIILLTMAVGVGTSTGFWQALIKKMTLRVPKSSVAYVVAGIGAFTSIASDAGYVVFIPLAAIIFAGYGRHPIAGIAAAFSGVSAGFSATLLPGASDAIFAEVWQSFAKESGYAGVFNATTMWFFQAASLVMITFVGGYITDKIVEPRLQHIEYKTHTSDKKSKSKEKDIKALTADEKRGLKFAFWAMITILALYVVAAWPGFGPLSVGHIQTGTVGSGTFELKEGVYVEVMDKVMEYVKLGDIQAWVKDSIFMKAISLNLGIMFFVAGVAYGKGARVIAKKEDVIDHQKAALKGVGAYIVISIVALNVINWFNYSNLGATATGHIAQWLQSSGLADHGMLIMIPAVLIITMLMNIIISGMSSKGYILGPIFLALASQLGLGGRDVVAIGVVYRIADSVTNIITPIMSYFIIILAFAQGYAKREEDFGAGNLISTMMPYTIGYLIFWLGLFVLWYVFQIPFGL